MVIDHINFAVDSGDDHIVVVGGDFIDVPVLIGTAAIEAPVLFCGIGHSLNPERQEWQPYKADDVQVQFYMMSPYVLKGLTHNNKGAAHSPQASRLNGRGLLCYGNEYLMSIAIYYQKYYQPRGETGFNFCGADQNNTYDDVVEKVAQQLVLEDTSKIRLTSHNCYSQQPKPQPIKYCGVERLSDMLVHYNQTSDILYFETLDLPLQELQGLKTLKIAFHNAKTEELSVHNIRLPKQSKVGDVINELKGKVELSSPKAELRILEVFYQKYTRHVQLFFSNCAADLDELLDYYYAELQDSEDDPRTLLEKRRRKENSVSTKLSMVVQRKPKKLEYYEEEYFPKSHLRGIHVSSSFEDDVLEDGTLVT
ncbi:unnamed protein product [Calypogeia fissa]